MTPLRCSFCHSRHPMGYLWNDSTMLICQKCSGEVLSWFNMHGVEMTEKNPLIADLCVNSHVVETAWWTYYDCVNQRAGTVQRIKRPDKRGGLRRIKSRNQIVQDFWITIDS